MKSEKKVVKKDKPYTLNCGKGIVCELSKGCFIGGDFSTEGNGGFVLVDDICDAYIGVDGEFDDEIENRSIDIPFTKGYPKIHKVEKTLKVFGSKTLKLN